MVFFAIHKDVIMNRILHSKELECVHFHWLKLESLLRVDNCIDHVRRLRQVEWGKSLGHEVEPINFVLFCVDDLPLQENRRLK